MNWYWRGLRYGTMIYGSIAGTTLCLVWLISENKNALDWATFHAFIVSAAFLLGVKDAKPSPEVQSSGDAEGRS
jgi:hypothetical protein